MAESNQYQQKMQATMISFQNPYENMKTLRQSYENEQQKYSRSIDYDKLGGFYTAPVTPDEYEQPPPAISRFLVKN